MAAERIDSIYDIPAIQAEQEKFIQFLSDSKKSIIDLDQHRITMKGSDLSTFTKAVQDLNGAINSSSNLMGKTTTSHSQLSAAEKAHQKTLNDLTAAQAKSTELTSKASVELTKQNLQNQLSVKANKEVAASVLGLVDDYGLLKKQYNEAADAAKNLQTIALKSGSIEDKAVADTATAKAKSLHDSLLTIEQGVGQSQRNVGNYTGALKILDTALTEAKQKLDSMSASERQNTAAGQSLQKEIGLLSTLVGQQDKGFVSLRREVMNATQALATMREQGLGHTESFKQLQIEVANGRRELIEFNNQQKLLSAESPKIAALTAVAKGLGAAYAVGAGAAALFADGDEKVEKELNKLVAVMTLLQGLTEFNKTMQERTAIATALLGVKEGILNGILAIRTFILTGSIRAQQEATVAEVQGIAVKEADAAATVATTAATEGASVAMIAFRTAIIATGIGALIVLLTLAVTALVEFANKTDAAITSVEDFNNQVDRLQKGLSDETDAIDFNTKRQILYLKQKGATEEEINARKILGDKYMMESYQKTADAQIEKAKEVAAQYGITIDGTIKSAEDAKKIIETMQDIKAKPEFAFDELSDKQKSAFDATISAVQKVADNYKAIQKLQNEDELSMEELKVGKKKKNLAVVNESTKEALDIEFELYKIAQARKLKLLEEEANDTKNSFSERIQFAEDYRLASIDLANRTAEHEIEADKIRLAALEDNLKKSKGSQRNNLLIEIENEKRTIILARAKRNDELLSIEDKFQKQQTQIVKDEQARQLKIYEDAAKAVNNIRTEQGGAIAAIRDTERASHDKLLHDKTISQDKYDKAEKKSINDNLILSLQADLQKEESLRTLAVLQHQSTVDIDNSIISIKAKITSAQNEAPEKKAVPSIAESELSILQSTESAINGLVDAKYQHEIDAIQKVIDLNNQRKDQEISNINASTLSNQEKAAQLIILDKTVAANNHKLAMQQWQLKVKEAKFDRDIAIGEILQNAIIAEFKLPAQAGFAGIAAGIAIGAAAAAQIAMLLARPMPSPPSYALGTDNHPGGPAIVGEAGKELVETNGKSFITSGPMLLKNLSKGAKVTPLTPDIMDRVMYNAMMIHTANKLEERNDRDIIEAIERGSNMTVQAMRKQKGTNVNINIDGYWGAYITKNVRE